MACPECGSVTESCSGYDAHDYTVWGDCCTNPDCEWTNIDGDERDA